MNLNIYFFTFGQVHTHPETGEAMKDYFIEIHAEKSDEAIDWIRARFGDSWSGMYTQKRFDRSFFPKGRYGGFITIHPIKHPTQ